MSDESMENFFYKTQLEDFAASVIQEYEKTKNASFEQEDLQDIIDYMLESIDMFVPSEDDLDVYKRAVMDLITALAIQFMDLVTLDNKLEEFLEDEDDEDGN